MDFQVNTINGIGQMTWNKNTDIRSDVYFSLMIKRGSWFADTSFGCRLHEIKKLTDSNLLLAHQYVLEALNWLIQTGRATTISAVATKADYNKISIDIQVQQANGIKLFYKIFSDVLSGKVTWNPVGV